MTAELIQTLIVSGIAAGAAGVLVWRLAGPYFTKATGTGSCDRCASGDKCATAPPQEQVIQIQRRTS